MSPTGARALAFAVQSSFCSHACLRHGLYRIDDGLIPGAAAVIAGKVRADLLATRNTTAGQQFLRGKQHARRAIAALQRVACDERLLQIGDLVGVGHAFDRVDAGSIALHGQHQAAAHYDTVHAHTAGAAHAMLAADMAAGEREVLAQKVDQRLARIDAFAHLFAVDGDRDLVEALVRAGPRLVGRPPRRSRTPARCVFTAPDACMSSGGSRSRASVLTAPSISPSASTGSALRARTGVGPTPKYARRRFSRRLPSARAQAASPTMA